MKNGGHVECGCKFQSELPALDFSMELGARQCAVPPTGTANHCQSNIGTVSLCHAEAGTNEYQPYFHGWIRIRVEVYSANPSHLPVFNALIRPSSTFQPAEHCISLHHVDPP